LTQREVVIFPKRCSDWVAFPETAVTQRAILDAD
jgi:hypothetical protein